MAQSKSTVLLENERADRFGKARTSLYLIWTREQGEKLRDIQNEQSPPTEPVESEAEEIRAKFNA
jgi:hypothetical protein